MRIAMVSEHASPLASIAGVDAGGQNVHVAELAAALTRRGHDVLVLTRRDDPDLPDRVETDAGYAVEHVPAGPPRYVPKDELLPFMAEFGRWAADRLGNADDGPFDVVHGHFWMSGLAALAAGQQTGTPVVQTFHALGSVKRRHQGPRDTSPPKRVALERLLCRMVDHVVATCSDEVTELQRLGADVRATTVVPCGVDVERFTPSPARRVASPLRLLTAGRPVPRKGMEDVIGALALAPDSELVVAGGPRDGSPADDPELARLRRLADDQGVGARVRFLGHVEHDAMPETLRSADVVVTAPWYEPFGIVPLEAMACGRAVIASAVGGLLDTVVDDVTGLLVPPRDPRALAAAIRALGADEVRREGFGLAGRERVVARYTWDRVAAETEVVYDRVRTRRGAVVGRAS